MSQDKIDLSPISQLYTDSLVAHGPVAKGVGWRDEAAQNLRFAKLLKVVTDRHAPFTINDLGCGYGALVDYLESSGLAPTGYLGLDISEPMLEVARTRASRPWARFAYGGVLDETADYSIASGIFNVRMEADPAWWENHIFTTLDNMAEYSRHGFAFNLLTTYADYYDPHLYYGDPLRYFDHCKRKWGKATLLHDYPLYEWTLTVPLN